MQSLQRRSRCMNGGKVCYLWRVRAILMLMFVWIMIGAVGIAYTEKISFGDALYFFFITGLTIGYGDIVVKTTVGRLIAVLIGFIGVLFAGLIVAAAVESIRKTVPRRILVIDSTV